MSSFAYYLETDGTVRDQQLSTYYEELYYVHKRKPYYVSILFGSQKAFQKFDLKKFLEEKNHLLSLQNNEIELFVHLSHEGWITPVKYLYEKLQTLDIDYDNVTYFSENMNSKEEIQYYSESTRTPLINFVFTLALWEDVRNSEINFIAAGNVRQYKSKVQHYDKKFLLLSRRWRTHRPMLMAMLYKHDLINQGHISFGASDDNKGWDDFLNEIRSGVTTKLIQSQFRESVLEDIEELKKLPEFLLDTTELVTNRAVFEDSIFPFYEDSMFSVVSETLCLSSNDRNSTWYDASGFMPTEKIFKTIAMMHPFIVVSCPHYLKNLRSLGFKTFSPMIDERYDDVEDNTDRLQAIVAEIKRLCAMNREQQQSFLNQCKKVCEYNYYHMLHSRNGIIEPCTFDLGLRKIDCRPKIARYNLHIPGWGNKTSSEDIDSAAEEINNCLKENNAGGVWLDESQESMSGHMTTDTTRDASQRQPALWKIHKIIRSGKLDCTPDNIFYSSMNVNGRETYREFCFHNNIKETEQIKIFHHNMLRNVCASPGFLSFVTQSRLDSNQVTKTKRFLAYQRNPQPARLVFTSECKKRNLISKALISCYTDLTPPNFEKLSDIVKDTPMFRNAEHQVEVCRRIDKMDIQRPLYRLSLDSDSRFSSVLTEHEYVNHYQKSFFSVVISSDYFAHHEEEENVRLVNFCEKVFKTIRAKHPFILIGQRRSLHYLHTLGFITFDGYCIDEAYDIAGDQHRLYLATDQVEKLCNMSNKEIQDWKNSVQHIVDHNYKLLTYYYSL